MSRKILNSDQRAILDRTDHDEETGLSLFHYKAGFTYEGDQTELGNIRGAVVNTENEVVHEFFLKHYEWTAGDDANRPTDESASDYNVFTAVEGALLRLFFYKDRWFLTTNKRLDAFQSRWSSKYSFGEMFEYTLKYLFPSHENNVMSYFYSQLDKAYQYMFLIRFNNDNRIVCHVQNVELSNRVIFLGTFQDGVSVMTHAHDQFLDHPVLSKMGRQKMFESPKTFEEWEAYILQEIDPMKNPGLIFVHKHINRHLKVVHPRYAELARLRGNQPNLAIRYLELRHDPESLEKYMKLYERNTRLFQQIEDILKEIARRINFWYTERFVHSRFVSVPYPEYNIMKKCHQWYLEDPQNRRIYIRVVSEFLNHESPLSLYRMINRIRQENYQHRHSIIKTSGRVLPTRPSS